MLGVQGETKKCATMNIEGGNEGRSSGFGSVQTREIQEKKLYEEEQRQECKKMV
jgi:hypothetical protein